MVLLGMKCSLIVDQLLCKIASVRRPQKAGVWKRRAVALLWFCLMSTGQSVQAASSDAVSAFLGHWEVDFSASEHPNDKLRYLYEVTLSDHRRRLASGQNRMGESPFQAMEDLRGLVNLGRLAEQITRTSVLEIKQFDETLTVTRDDNFSLRCDLVGQVQREGLGASDCRIKDQELLFELKLPGDVVITHRLILSQRRDRLSMATSIFAGGVSQPFTVNRVYQPFTPAETGFACEYHLGKGKVCQLGTGK